MRVVMTSDLPPPTSNKTGWPWTQEPAQYSETDYDVNYWPKISIVTPNYNYGQFLEETIRSVLLQGYPNLEYIIIDGGSTDNSVEIIKKYENWLTCWVSEKDQGPSSAINKGLEMATGEWFNWINSDDLLLPNALKTLIKISEIVPDAKWISGASAIIDEYSSFVDIHIPWRTQPSGIALGYTALPQDATFINLSFINELGIKLNDQYDNIFDRVFHLQLAEHQKPILTTVIFSAWRWHGQIKTLNTQNIRYESSIGEKQFVRSLSPVKRLLFRLVTTRFAKFLRPLLGLGAYYGLFSGVGEWRAVVYDRNSCKFVEKPARFAMYI